jgi:prolipoprotein diacylglyceryltransferase
MHIHSDFSQLYFQSSYLLSFLLVAFFILRYGKKKNYPLAEWSLIYLILAFFFTLGTYMGTYNLNDWKYVFSNGQLPDSETTGRTVLGGLLLGFTAYQLLVKKIYGTKYQILDAFAFALPLGMAVQRIGCIKAGCCHGVTSNGFLNFIYDPNSLAFVRQLNEGLISPFALESLPVYPTQLFHLLSALLVAGILFYLKPRIKRSGVLGLLSLVLILFFRFIIEFFADPATNNAFSEIFFGLKKVQWFILIAMLGLALLIGYQIRFPSLKTQKHSFKEFHSFIIYAAMLVLFAMIVNHLRALEYVKMICLFSLVGGIQLYKLIRSPYNTSQIFRISYIGLITILLLWNGKLGAQTFGLDLEKDGIYESKSGRFLSLNTNLVNYTAYHTPPNAINNGCGSEYYSYDSPLYKHQWIQIGAEYQYVKRTRQTKKDWRDLSYKIGLDWGIDISNDAQIKKHTQHIYTSGTIEGHLIGLTGGLHLSNNLNKRLQSSLYIDSPHQTRLNLYPEVSIRLFSKRIFYLFAGLNSQYYYPYKMGGFINDYYSLTEERDPVISPNFSGGFGSSFGTYNRFLLETGFSQYGFFIENKFRINKNTSFGFMWRMYNRSEYESTSFHLTIKRSLNN